MRYQQPVYEMSINVYEMATTKARTEPRWTLNNRPVLLARRSEKKLNKVCYIHIRKREKPKMDNKTKHYMKHKRKKPTNQQIKVAHKHRKLHNKAAAGELRTGCDAKAP